MRQISRAEYYEIVDPARNNLHKKTSCYWVNQKIDKEAREFCIKRNTKAICRMLAWFFFSKKKSLIE